MRLEAKPIPFGTDTVYITVEGRDARAYARKNITAPALLSDTAVALIRKSILAVLLQKIIDISEGQISVMSGIGPYSQIPPGGKDVTVFICWERPVSFTDFLPFIRIETQRPVKQLFRLRSFFYLIKNDCFSCRIVA